MINDIENIINEIDEKVNAESVESRNKVLSKHSTVSQQFISSNTHENIKNMKSHPSLAQRMSNRLLKYKQNYNKVASEDFQTRASVKSGNNP